MSWLLAALIASFISGTSAIFDKKLLARQGLADPVAYTFWVGILGLFVVILAPFGFVALPLKTILTAILGGAIFLCALFAFFSALYKYNALGFLQLVSGITPILTLFISSLLLKSSIGLGNILGFIIIIFGSFIFLSTEDHSARFGVFYLSLLSALCFSASDLIKKAAFNQGPFIPVFIWTSVGGALVALLIISFPKLRVRVFASTNNTAPSNRTLYLLNRGWAASAAIASHYAIFLGHPALVETVHLFKYVVIFAASVFILKEKMPGKIFFWKLVGTIFMIIGVGWLGLVGYVQSIPANANMQWGVTFSQKFARELEGDDWEKMYIDILDDLQAKNLRLIAYWDAVEPENDRFEFGDLDWQIEEAKKRGARVLLAIGRKTPRWPECHIPEWVKKYPESEQEFRNHLLNYIENTINHYKFNDTVVSWQIENEPLFPFGDCKPLGMSFLKKEISLARSLDKRPIALTDSGELGFSWPVLSVIGDSFGTTLYRYVYNRILGDIEYTLIPPGYFQFKALWARDILKKDIFIVELQGEPWQSAPLSQTTIEKQYDTMNPERFKGVADYAEASGFPMAYWWGVEWWHWTKNKLNNPEMWNLAKQLFIK